MRLASRALAAVAMFVVFAVLAAPCRSQEQIVVHSDGDRQLCTVQLANFCGTREGGLGFLTVVAENRDQRAHLVKVDASSRWSGGDVAVQCEILLGPLERTKWCLPRPNTRLGTFQIRVDVDSARYDLQMSPGTADGLVGLLLTEHAELQSWATVVMQALPSFTTEAPVVQIARPEHLHGDWRLFTGFDAVLVDGRCGLARETQEALRRFVFAGGTVVAAEPERLPAGPLRDLAVATAATGGRHGLGRCVVATERERRSTESPAAILDLPRAGVSGWPAPASLLEAQPIPGLGQAPALLFLLVMLSFAILAGPVNFLLLRKWKRPLLVLATVPALGIGTTLVMLGHALVSDGLGVRGVVRSWTLLDQERHEAASISMRTLFCGFSPSSLAMGPDTFVLAPRAFHHAEFRDPDRWRVDANTQQLDGGVLPSRRATPLLSAQQGTARQRLRVRVVDNDNVELLGDGGVETTGEVLLRDFDGTWWLGTAPRLRRATRDEAGAAIERSLQATAVLPAAPHHRYEGELQSEALVQSVHATVARFFGDGELPPGSYLAQVAAAPWLDDHGLRADYDSALHCVVGRLAAEDVVR